MDVALLRYQNNLFYCGKSLAGEWESNSKPGILQLMKVAFGLQSVFLLHHLSQINN